MIKKPLAMQGDPGSIPRLKRFRGEGNGYQRQYSCLENSMDSLTVVNSLTVVVKGMSSGPSQGGRAGLT